jgi:hypothetical protein
MRVRNMDKSSKTVPEFNDPAALARFKKVAAAYTKDVTTSRAKARNTLVRLGMSTKSGNVASKYKK